MRKAWVKAWVLVVPLCGCSLYFGPSKGSPDAQMSMMTIDANPYDQCLTQQQRSVACHYDVSGTVVDLATQAAVTDPVELHLTTAWDDPPWLFPPDACPPLAEQSVGSGGAFSLMSAPCDSPAHPPFALVEVVPGPGGSVAKTAWDYKLTCGAVSDPADCGAVMATLATPSDAVVQAWRAQMLADGMPNADTRGLALIMYRETDGTPAAGVQPTLAENTMELPLPPGTAVRFLAADRMTLVRADAVSTGVSGLTIVALPNDSNGRVGGVRAADSWPPTGIIVSPGWIFSEDRTL
jgi:hypothetical protein